MTPARVVIARLRAKAPRLVPRVVLLCVLLTALVSWQRGFMKDSAVIEGKYLVTAATGINREARFFYFLYHLGLFPVASDVPTTVDTKAGAERLLHTNPEKLRQDEGSTFREGDRGRTFLYLVDGWLHHRSLNPSLKPAHAIAFIGSLCLLLISFWAMKRTLEGVLLVALIGSDPMELFAVYRQENVYSWGIITMILLLALLLPVMQPGAAGARFARGKFPWVAAIVAGLLVALVRTIRSEPVPLVASAALVFMTLPHTRWWKRSALVAVLVISFFGGQKASNWAILAKVHQAQAAVKAAGGTPYAGPLREHHFFWHPMYCGLGDFDKKHGYAWDDRVPYTYAYPVLIARGAKWKLQPNGYPYHSMGYYDDAKRHEVYFPELPGYEEILRDKIVSDIKKDPKWYLGILKQRVWKILTDTTPVGIALHSGSIYVGGPLLGVFAAFLAIGLLVLRRGYLLKLLLFSTPLSVGAFLVYSGGGMTYYGTFQIFGVFILLVLARDGMKAWWAKRVPGWS